MYRPHRNPFFSVRFGADALMLGAYWHVKNRALWIAPLPGVAVVLRFSRLFPRRTPGTDPSFLARS